MSGADRRVLRHRAVDFGKTLSIALPPIAAAAVALGVEGTVRSWPALASGAAISAALTWWVRAGLTRRLRTASAVLASFREGDFSIRARSRPTDALVDDVLREVNALGDTLRAHRLGEAEAWALLRKVMSEVDVVVLAFDGERRLKLANEAAANVLAAPAASLFGESAAALGVADLLEGDAPRVVRESPALGAGPWELRRGAFRLSGEPHSLVVLSNVRSALREQERDAWKRLIRVMGHELNNSLAPIQSISESLHKILENPTRPEGWEEDVTGGLAVIARRSEALGRFMGAYAELARLPPPARTRVDVGPWVRRAAALEKRVTVQVVEGPDVTIQADADQLDQLLINLIKNGADAALETKGAVRTSWSLEANTVTVTVEDEGPGVSETANLFVPFFTTKPGGSGIGLALARQIAEAHGGDVALRARPGGGAVATIRLPTGA